jgi:chromate transporter
VLSAGLIGYFGGRAAMPVFQVGGGGHGPAKGAVLTDAESALGETIPTHAAPSMGWSLKVAGILLALWLGPVAVLLATFGFENVFSEIS